jgi:hypothetical protein
MGTTPILKIPYVEATDLLANYPVADKAQADKMEAVVSPLVADTGWINLTPVSGTGACRYRVIGPNVWMQVNLTGMTSIANGANGPIVNAGAIPAAYCPGVTYYGVGNLGGQFMGLAVVNTNGSAAQWNASGGAVTTSRFYVVWLKE